MKLGLFSIFVLAAANSHEDIKWVDWVAESVGKKVFLKIYNSDCSVCISTLPHWKDLMKAYEPESDVYVAIAQESTRNGTHGSGWDVYEHLNQTQGVKLGPSVWCGDPTNLTRYVWGEETQTLL